MNKKENQRVRLTRQLFRNSLVRLLRKKSIHEVSITELCQEAGINRSTFYKYYDTVYDILTEIENSFIAESRQCLAAIDSIKNPGILQPLCTLLHYTQDNREATLLLLNNGISSDFSDQLLKYVINFYAISNTPISDYTLAYIISGSVAIIKKWLTAGAKDTPETIAAFIYQPALAIIKAQESADQKSGMPPHFTNGTS